MEMESNQMNLETRKKIKVGLTLTWTEMRVNLSIISSNKKEQLRL